MIKQFLRIAFAGICLLFAACITATPISASTVEYKYDAIGRITKVIYDGTTTISYSYDGAGNRILVGPEGSSPPPQTGALWSQFAWGNANWGAGVADSYSVQFSADPSQISAGGSTTLTWSSTATGASIDNGIGTVNPSDSRVVQPSATTTYTLALTGPNGPVSKQATVTVTTNPAAPPTGTLTPGRATINAGESTTLIWSSSNATTASINNNIGTVTPVSGASIPISPGSTTTYTLTLTNAAGVPAYYQTTVTVVAPPSGSLTADPPSIAQGDSSFLSWTTSNATSAEIDNGIDLVSTTGGLREVRPSTTTNYTLKITNSAGTTINRSATVTVSPAFSGTIQIPSGSSANLRSLANASGYNGSMPANINFVVANGVSLIGTAGASGGGAGGIVIDSGTWPASTYSIHLTLTIQSGGQVIGGGGAGGDGNGASGGAGGDAVYSRAPMNVIVDSGGILKGGGGGGAGGGTTTVFDENIGDVYISGGGGGGGAPNGPGGAGGGAWPYGTDGSAGTTSGGGAAGSGGSYNGVPNAGGFGGHGGGYGAEGYGGTGDGVGANGTAGYAIRKNGNSVTVTNNGTIVGPQS